MNSKEILELFPQAKSKSMSCFLLMRVHHRFTRICSTLDHSSNSNCYFCQLCWKFLPASNICKLHDSCSRLRQHHSSPTTTQRILGEFQAPPKKSRKHPQILPPHFFKKETILPTFFWGGLPFRGRNIIPGVQIWRYQQRSGQARQERYGQLVGSGAGVVDGSWEWEYLPKFLHTYKVERVGRYLN